MPYTQDRTRSSVDAAAVSGGTGSDTGSLRLMGTVIFVTVQLKPPVTSAPAAARCWRRFQRPPAVLARPKLFRFPAEPGCATVRQERLARLYKLSNC